MKVLLAIFTITLNSVFCMAQLNWQNNPVGAVFARQGGETPEGTFRFTNDGYEVYTLVCSDKSFQPASLFYGENNVDKQKVDALAPEGKIPTSMNCFVVRTLNGYIMFDTGLPASKGGKTLERLTSLKISPADITSIYITHGHFDHIGGLLDDAGKAVYPNAKLYIPKAELSFISETMKEAYNEVV
ncbi:MAG: MBL fold metallo-hydrolase [Muribaculaceae bacterium]|nr:MBL fold metallo-hydrolase [Muribaculaceae bacterium]